MIYKILPLILTFWLGYFLKRIKIFDLRAADAFLKTVFYVTLPSIVFLAIKSLKMDIQYLYLPIISVSIIFITYPIALVFSKKANLKSTTRGTFILSSLIINTGFTLPFLMAYFGKKSVAIYTFYDLGNQFLVYTFVYYIAMKYGTNREKKIEFIKFFKIPPLWALFLGIIFNITNVQVPVFVENTLTLLGSPTKFLIMFSLGIYFSFRLKNYKMVFAAIILRSVLGFFWGLLFIKLFAISGILKIFVILFSAAPVGYNTLVLSSLENLDMDFAAEVVSISLLLGLFYIPILIFWVG